MSHPEAPQQGDDAPSALTVEVSIDAVLYAEEFLGGKNALGVWADISPLFVRYLWPSWS